MIGSIARRHNLPAASASTTFRLLGLVGRMALVVYIARFLGLEAVAHYGFVVGAAALAVALTGFGLTYRIQRTIVVDTPASVMALCRDRFLLRAGSTSACVAIATVAIGIGAPHSPLLSWSVAAIVIGEPLVTDIQQALVARQRPVAGNALLFARAAAWIPFVIAIGTMFPRERDIALVFLGWAIGIWAALAIVVIASVRAFPRSALVPIDWTWARTAPASAPGAYLSDIAFAVSIYSDRFLVTVLVGEKAAGAVVFVWSFCNAIVPLMQSSVFDQWWPSLVRLHAQGAHREWLREMKRGCRDTLILSAILGVSMVIFLIALTSVIGISHPGVTLPLFVTMTFATCLRLQADALRHGLVSLDREASWTSIDIAVLSISPVIGAFAISGFGVYGAAMQMLITALALYCWRRSILRRSIPDCG